MYIKLRSEFLVSMQREVRRLLRLIDLSLEDSRSFFTFFNFSVYYFRILGIDVRYILRIRREF